MAAKFFELVDLFTSLILMGSLIRQIPVVETLLTQVENLFDRVYKIFSNKTDEEIIHLFSKICKYILIFSLGLIFILSKIKENFLLGFSPKLSFIIGLILIILSYLKMALNIAKPTKKIIIKYIKSNKWIFLSPFVFLFSDLFLDSNILDFFGQKFFNLILELFHYQIINSLWANFLAYALVIYIGTALQFIMMWLISQPSYLLVWVILKIIKHPQKQERVLFLVLLLFFLNKLILIFWF